MTFDLHTEEKAEYGSQWGAGRSHGDLESAVVSEDQADLTEICFTFLIEMESKIIFKTKNRALKK